MVKNNLIPPYMKDKKLGLPEKYGLLRCIPCFFITLIECSVIAAIIYGLKELIKWRPTVGFSIIAFLALVFMVGQSLIVWKKKKDKRDGNIAKE